MNGSILLAICLNLIMFLEMIFIYIRLTVKLIISYFLLFLMCLLEDFKMTNVPHSVFLLDSTIKRSLMRDVHFPMVGNKGSRWENMDIQVNLSASMLSPTWVNNICCNNLKCLKK